MHYVADISFRQLYRKMEEREREREIERKREKKTPKMVCRRFVSAPQAEKKKVHFVYSSSRESF